MDPDARKCLILWLRLSAARGTPVGDVARPPRLDASYEGYSYVLGFLRLWPPTCHLAIEGAAFGTPNEPIKLHCLEATHCPKLPIV
jgi:hypothetical protein